MDAFNRGGCPDNGALVYLLYENYFTKRTSFIYFEIDQNPLYGGALAVGDSATVDAKARLTSFKDQLSKMIEGDAFPFTLILDDPTGNSYLQVIKIRLF